MFRNFLILFSFFITVFTATGCKLATTEIVNIDDPEIIVPDSDLDPVPNPELHIPEVPTFIGEKLKLPEVPEFIGEKFKIAKVPIIIDPVEITITGLPNSIVYFSSIQPPIPSSNNLYIARGLGGLGVASNNEQDKLEPFEGLKINVSSWVPSENIQVDLIKNGDSICKSLFEFNSKSSMVKIINSHSINTLIECNLQITVKAKNLLNEVTTYSNDYSFTFNPTLQEYALNNDPLVTELIKQTKSTTIVNLISHLRNQDLSLSLNINNKDISQVNALTGLSYITSLDLSNSGLQKSKALTYLTELQELNVSNTKLTSWELALLASKSNITKINLSGINLTTLSFLKDKFKNLVELNLSNNSDLFRLLPRDDIQNISALNKLEILNVSNTGLTDFAPFRNSNNLDNTLKQLDFSNNPIKKIDSVDREFLKYLTNLEVLNISKNHLEFESLNIYLSDSLGNSKLKTFIYQGFYSKSGIQPECKNEDFTSNILKLSLPSMFENIDFQGQACLDNGGNLIGLTNTNIFAKVQSLKNLDISATAVSDLSGLKRLQKLEKVTIINKDGDKIPMLRSVCKTSLSPSVTIDSCEVLSEINSETKVFTENGKFIVPKNVWHITIRGCSGANGGAGGGASGSLSTEIKSGTENFTVLSGVYGGNSGIVNNISIVPGFGPPNTTDVVKYYDGGYTWVRLLAYSTQHGGNGGIATQTRILADGVELYKFDPPTNISTEQICAFGGKNGLGGNSIESTAARGRQTYAGQFKSGAGAQNIYPAMSSFWTTKEYNVYPGETIEMSIGQGGAGGFAGMPTHVSTKGSILEKWLGNPGLTGTKGDNGRVVIEWFPDLTKYSY